MYVVSRYLGLIKYAQRQLYYNVNYFYAYKLCATNRNQLNTTYITLGIIILRQIV